MSTSIIQYPSNLIIFPCIISVFQLSPFLRFSAISVFQSSGPTINSHAPYKNNIVTTIDMNIEVIDIIICASVMSVFILVRVKYNNNNPGKAITKPINLL